MTAARLAQLDALQIAINNLRFEANRGNVDYETADMREFLLAAYAMTEIDAIWDAAQEIPSPDEFETTADRMARPFAPHEYVRCAR